MISRERIRMLGLLNDMYHSQSRSFKEQYERNYIELLEFILGADREDNPLIEKDCTYVLTEDMDNLKAGDYFVSFAGDKLRHVRSNRIVTVTKENARFFINIGTKFIASGLESNERFMKAADSVIKTISLFSAGDKICLLKDSDIKATIEEVSLDGCFYRLDNGTVLPFERQIFWKKVED